MVGELLLGLIEEASFRRRLGQVPQGEAGKEDGEIHVDSQSKRVIAEEPLPISAKPLDTPPLAISTPLDD